MSDQTAIVAAASGPPQLHAMSAHDVQQQVNLIQQVMHQVMHVDEHYGVIVKGQKPSLYKAGAEKLCLTFRLNPEYVTSCDKDGDHREYTATCTLYHIPTGQRVASGVGLCSTREAKYAYRQGGRTCPACGAEAIRKSDTEWYCWKKLDGCGKTYGLSDPAITGQKPGRSPNPDLPDTYNTVLKMACKRALIAATLNGTAASDLFTQDVEDLPADLIQERGGGKRREAEPPPQSAPTSGRALWQLAADLCGGTKAEDFFRLKDGLAALVSSAGHPVRGKDRDAFDQIERCPLGAGIVQRCQNTLAESGKEAIVGAVDSFLDWLAGDMSLATNTDGDAGLPDETQPPTELF